jgi:uncharacterized protein (DUF927 family)
MESKHGPDFMALASAALSRADSLLPAWLPGGRFRGREFVCGDLGGGQGESCSINSDSGAWSDFATGEHGTDLISLFAAINHLDQGEAARELARLLGVNGDARKAPQARKADKDDWTPVLPVPADAPPPYFRHFRLGLPAAHWTYHDREGRILGHVARFETADGKEVLPLTCCQIPGGKQAWRWKSFPVPRPLYCLDRLVLAKPDAPVLIVEGEKTADAAQRLFPGAVVMTWPGGGKAVGKADFSPLAGRSRVNICPDADKPGFEAALAVAARAMQAGVVEVFIMPPPPGVPEGWDLADPLPDGATVEKLVANTMGVDEFAALARERYGIGGDAKQSTTRENDSLRAQPQPTKSSLPEGYMRRKGGIFYSVETKNADGELVEDWSFLCSNFTASAMTRDGEGEAWGLVLEIPDADGQVHEYVMPKDALAGDGVEYRRELLSRGLDIAAGRTARAKLHDLLARLRPQVRARCVSRCGWHDRLFVLPDGSAYGEDHGERIVLQPAPREHAFRIAGSLNDWKNEVGKFAMGNSRLALAIACAPAAPLAYLLQVEGGGFHLHGRSSSGKTTILTTAGSFAGGGGLTGFIRSWRATDNALEAVAAAHSDNLLILDEVGQAGAEVVGATIYMLGNRQGKSRARRDGSGRKPQEWRITWLSSGETEISAKCREKGQRHMAGQEVRACDVELRDFDVLHGFASGKDLADHLKRAAQRVYGAPLREFLAKLTANLDEAREMGGKLVADFERRMVSAEADGQVSRVAARFGLVAAAGEIASLWGILPWPKGEATQAAETCFSDWLAARGGTEPAEVRDGIAAVRAFVAAHGHSRFQAWGELPNSDASNPKEYVESSRVLNRVGFRWKPASDGQPADYCFFKDVFRSEVLHGLDVKTVCAALEQRGLLERQDNEHWTIRYHVPSIGSVTVYHIRAAILDG